MNEMTYHCCANIRASFGLTVGAPVTFTDDFAHTITGVIAAVLADGFVTVEWHGMTYDAGMGPGVDQWPATLVAKMLAS